MSFHKIVVTIDETLLQQVDRLVAEKRFPNRSSAIQEAVREKLERMQNGRLLHELAKLDVNFERKLADEALEGVQESQEY